MNISEHAQKRAAEFGLDNEDVAIILLYATPEEGEQGRTVYSICGEKERSKVITYLLKRHNSINAEKLTRILESTVVVSPDGRWLITVYRTNVNSEGSLTHTLGD